MGKQLASAPRPHRTRGSVLDDLDFSPSEQLELRVKGELHRDLLRHIAARHLTQGQVAELLSIHQPDASNLLNGRLSKFSVGKLIQLASKLDLHATIKLTKARPQANKVAELRAGASAHTGRGAKALTRHKAAQTAAA